MLKSWTFCSLLKYRIVHKIISILLISIEWVFTLLQFWVYTLPRPSKNDLSSSFFSPKS